MSQLLAEQAQRIHENSSALAQAGESAGYGIRRRSFGIYFSNVTKDATTFRGRGYHPTVGTKKHEMPRLLSSFGRFIIAITIPVQTPGGKHGVGYGRFCRCERAGARNGSREQRNETRDIPRGRNPPLAHLRRDSRAKPPIGRGLAVSVSRGPYGFKRAHPRRDRHGKRTHSPRHSLLERTARLRLHQIELRRDPLWPFGKRVVRSRKRRVYRRDCTKSGTFRTRE